MKKERLLFSFLVLLIGSLCFNASAYSNDELVSIARKASKDAAYKMSVKVSPHTHEDADYDIDYDSFYYDSYEKELEFQVTLSWSAKDQMFFGTRDICKTWGKMYVDLSNGKNKMNVRFVPKGKNHWCGVCEDSHGLDILAEALILVVTMSN